ncbi:MAG: hypothetical protein CSYNP_00106 [Syntrophus sp. SKADARSKE-3]|nr:hypothetical protein [Syntrophus sp. SKADARSKE-3]
MKANAWLHRAVASAIVMAFLASCAGLPAIKPLDPAETWEIAARCRAPFAEGSHRVVHALEAQIGGRQAGTLLGITLFDPSAETLHGAILTLEGFVLFDARYDKGLVVNRAVPPFDAPHFGSNMMEDIRLLFLAPKGRLLAAGHLADYAGICRYEVAGGAVEDVIVYHDSTWEIRMYGADGGKIRSVRVLSLRNHIPEAVELTGFQSVGYTLRMTLISTEAVGPEAVEQSK